MLTANLQKHFTSKRTHTTLMWKDEHEINIYVNEYLLLKALNWNVCGLRLVWIIPCIWVNLTLMSKLNLIRPKFSLKLKCKAWCVCHWDYDVMKDNTVVSINKDHIRHMHFSIPLITIFIAIIVHVLQVVLRSFQQGQRTLRHIMWPLATYVGRVILRYISCRMLYVRCYSHLCWLRS